MILELRGSGGSGKSHVGHRLVQDYGVREVYWPSGPGANPPGAEFNRNKAKPKLVGHELRGGLFVMGPYRLRPDGTEGCGGGDNIYGGPRVQMAFVERAAAKFEYVFWESLMASLMALKHLEPLRDRLRALGHEIVFPTLDTTAERCKEQMWRRNGGFAKGQKGRPIKVETTIYYAHKRTHILREGMLELGLDVPLVPHETAYAWIVDRFKEEGWRP